jgi:restriction endonuclease Mrr
MGWETEVSDESMDEGVDVLARKQTPYEQTTLIQAKRYGPNTTVGSPGILQYASLDRQYTGVDKVVVVTTNEFTKQARDLAERLNVKIINGETLAELVVEHNTFDLVNEYLEFVTTVDHEDGTEHPDQVFPGTLIRLFLGGTARVPRLL